jgi:hypothetical protein
MKITTSFMIGLAATLLSLSAPADAALISLLYKGVVLEGEDFTGVFGAPADLTGLDFTAEYLVDTDLGQYLDGGMTLAVAGGSTDPTGSPVLWGKVTIGGATFVIDGDNEGSMASMDDSGGSLRLASINRQTGDADNGQVRVLSALATGGPGQLPLDLTDSFSGALPDDDRGGFIAYDLVGGVTNRLAYASFRTTSVSFGPVAAVPEAGSWALMILGLAVTGGAIRRRSPRERPA